MAIKTPGFSLKLLAGMLAGLVLLGVSGWAVYHFFIRSERQHYTVGIFFDSTNQKPSDLQEIQLIIGKKAAEINEHGGMAGRELRLKYFDDKGKPEIARQLVQKSIQDKNLVAYLGCWGSTKAIAVAKLVGEQQVPYIGGYSLTSIGQPYPNMFTYEIGIDHFAYATYNLLKTRSKRVAFIGNPNDNFTKELYRKINAMNQADQSFKISVEKWYTPEHKFTPAELNEFAEAVKTNADFLFLSVNPQFSNTLLKALWQQKIFVPVFSAFIDIPELDPTIPGYKQAEIYDISVFGIPSALNMRTQILKDKYRAELKPGIKLDYFLGLGALLSDALGLVNDAAKTNPKEKNIRKRITKGLQDYANGTKLYRGWFTNWYFNRDRSLLSEAVLGWKPPTYSSPILAPYQFLRTDTGLAKTQVLYTNIDLIKIDQVSDEDGSFNAAFYLEINSRHNISISQIDFANVARNEINQEPLMDIKLVHADSAAGENQLFNYLYKVSGKFYFVRDLKDYPFDTQQFTITLQTNSAYQPFLIQPPSQQLRDTIFRSPGWEYVSNFVGYDQDVINTGSSFISGQTHIPYYKFIYSYVLKRTHVDFFLKVLTPLLAILIISYFSVFIPYREFEALCGIQVTALLSAIALYFSTYKPELQTATVSDKIFIFTYIMITTLVVTSIFIYALHHQKKEAGFTNRMLRIYQYFVFPCIVVGFTLIIIIF